MRRAREIWVQIIGQFERSGLTQEAFAEQRGIPVSTLRAWIYKLRRATEEAPVLPVAVIASTAPTARQQQLEAVAIEVELPDAVRVRFPPDTAASVIADVVALVRSRC
jgi:hypothetical protein